MGLLGFGSKPKKVIRIAPEPVKSDDELAEEALFLSKHGNNEAANRIWVQLAEKGYARGQFNLGYAYSNGEGIPQDKVEALKWYLKAAEQGHAFAQFNAALMYETGDGIPKDTEQAIFWYSKAADQGDEDAVNKLEKLRTPPVKTDDELWDEAMALDKRGEHEAANRIWLPLAEKGHVASQYCIGVSYSKGEGFAQDKTEAAKWYRKAAEQGHARGQSNLGYAYSHGNGVPQDKAEALKWYLKAAEQGRAVAQYNAALMYETGDGIPQDTEQAIFWYSKAAEQGDEDAVDKLAKLRAQPKPEPESVIPAPAPETAPEPAIPAPAPEPEPEPVVPAPIAEPEPETVVPAPIAEPEPEPVIPAPVLESEPVAPAPAPTVTLPAEVEDAYKKGIEEYNADNDTEAYKWLLKAAEAGHAKAQYQIGLMCYYGRGVAENAEKALSWCLKAAEQGYSDAQFRCARMYKEDGETKADFVKALYWYKKTAEQGDKVAQFNCHLMYYEEKYFLVDKAKAFYWAERSAISGFNKARLVCAQMLDNGEGTAVNKAVALYWYERVESWTADFQVAALRCGEMYEHGEGTDVNKFKAYEWYKRAADTGYIKAQFRLGMCYLQGTIVPANRDKAEEWFRLAREQGDEDAIKKMQELYAPKPKTESAPKPAAKSVTQPVSQPTADPALEKLYQKGKTLFNEREYEKAFSMFKKAAKRGHLDAQYECGVMHWLGYVTKSEKKALVWLEQAAEQGHRQAQVDCGSIYYYNKQDKKTAFRWYKRAAEQGSYEAIEGCIKCCKYQNDDVNAFLWCKRGLELGDGSFSVQLGEMYYYGRGVESDKKKALELLTPNVESYETAAYICGLIYKNGEGVAVNLEKAYYCFLKAEHAKNSKAGAERRALEPTIIRLRVLNRRKRRMPLIVYVATLLKKEAYGSEDYGRWRRYPIVKETFSDKASHWIFERRDGIPVYADAKERAEQLPLPVFSIESEAAFRLGREVDMQGLDYGEALVYYDYAAELGHPLAAYRLLALTGNVYQDFYAEYASTIISPIADSRVIGGIDVAALRKLMVQHHQNILKLASEGDADAMEACTELAFFYENDPDQYPELIAFRKIRYLFRDVIDSSYVSLAKEHDEYYFKHFVSHNVYEYSLKTKDFSGTSEKEARFKAAGVSRKETPNDYTLFYAYDVLQDRELDDFLIHPKNWVLVTYLAKCGFCLECIVKKAEEIAERNHKIHLEVLEDEAREAAEQRRKMLAAKMAMQQELEAYQDRLDQMESTFNFATLGVYGTDLDVSAMGKINGDEYSSSAMFRDMMEAKKREELERDYGL